jgi:hypothetical protein
VSPLSAKISMDVLSIKTLNEKLDLVLILGAECKAAKSL